MDAYIRTLQHDLAKALTPEEIAELQRELEWAIELAARQNRRSLPTARRRFWRRPVTPPEAS